MSFDRPAGDRVEERVVGASAGEVDRQTYDDWEAGVEGR